MKLAPGDVVRIVPFRDVQNDAVVRTGFRLQSKPLYHTLSVNDVGVPSMSGNAGELPEGKTAIVLGVYTSPDAPKSRKATMMYIVSENSQGWTWVSSDVEVISRVERGEE